MRERNGVSTGQPVRDLDGTSLGKVVRLYAWGFLARRGLFGREFVVRYDEVRAVRDGALVVARSARDLFDLAAGGVPDSWRIPTPPPFPTAATPAEARDVRRDVAAGRVAGVLDDDDGAPVAGARPPSAPVSDAELRSYVETRGQGIGTPSSGSDRE